MAKKQIDTIGIRFEATEAINDAEKLQQSLKGMGDRYKYVCDQLKDVSNLSREAVSALEKEKTSLEKSMSSVAKLVDNAITQLRNIDDILSDLSGAKFNELTRARNAQALRLKRISPDMEGYEEELEMFRRVNREIELRNKSFREMSEEEREALKITRDLIVANAKRFSVSEIQNAIKFTKELRDLEKIDSDEYKRYQQEADALQEVLDLNKKLAEEKAKQDALQRRKDALDDPWNASVDQLKEALKLTEQLRDATTDSWEREMYKEEAENLQKVIDKTKELSMAEQQMQEHRRQLVVNDPTKASVEQIKEAIKLTEKLRDTKPIDSADYKQYNKELDKLKETLKGSEESMGKVKLNAKQMKDVLKNLSSQKLETLEQAASQLKESLHTLTPNTKAYISASEKLRTVNGRIKDLKDDWEEHKSQISQTVDRLKSYILVYAGWNFVSGKLKEVISANLELSDSLSDIQKTTQLAGESLRMLSRDIDSIDTRTTQEELHKLAATAGQMGISSRTEVLGFVKASNQLNVALNELGEDGVLSLSKIAQLTGDVQRMGIEKSLLSIGSSINELSANSSASAGPIADFMRRVGGLAPVAKLATSDLAALGATADALGQPIEVAGTAMNKFIMSLVTNTEEISYALNLDLETMKRLIDSGRTMEAIIMVLDKVRTSGESGGAALSSIFKELGGEGTRITQVLSAMAQNTQFLREQVTLSTLAFHEATSATNEYNVKNENAAAIAQRISNTLREVFVNADYTSGITNALKSLLKIVETFTSASNAGVVFRSVLILVGVQLSATAMGLNKLWKSLFVARDGTISLTKAWANFNRVLKNNAFGLVLAAGLALYNLITKWNREQRMLTAHINELNAALRKEKDLLEKVNDELERVKSIKDANEQTNARKTLISNINREYGTYLEYQLSEAAGYQEIAAALRLVNEQLELKYANQIYEKRMEKATETYTDTTERTGESLLNTLSKMPEVGDAAMSKYQDLLSLVKELAKTSGGADLNFNIRSEEWEKVRKILPHIREYLGPEDQELIYKYSNISNYLQNLYDAEVKYIKASARARAEQNSNVTKETEDVAAAQEAYIEASRARMLELMKMPIDSIEKEKLRDHYKQILDYGNILLADAESKYAKRKAELDAKKAAIDSGDRSLTERMGFSTEDNPIEVFDYQASLDAAREEFFGPLEALLGPIQKAYEGDAWGKALNIPGLKAAFGDLQNLNSASVNDLVRSYKELQEAGKKYTTAELFNAHFGTEFKTRDEVLKYLKESAGKVKEQLATLGYTTSGNFDWSTEKGRSEAEKYAKKEFEAAKSALKAYYEEQETIIKQAYLNREITHEEMTRRISKNEQEQSEAFVDLYNVLLGEAKKYDTNIEEILKGKDLQKLAQFLTKLGPAMVDGMRLGREQSEGAIRDEAIKMRQVIEKALLEGDMFGKIEDDFRSMLDELGLLMRDLGNGVLVGIDEAMAKGLINQLESVADKAYTVNEEGLRELLSQNIEYGDWWESVEDEYMTLVLQKLRGYYDDRLEMQRRYAQKMQREWQQYYKQTGGEAAYDANKQMIEGAEDNPEGYVKGAGDYNRQRGLIKAKAMLEASKLEDEIASYQERLKTLTEGSAEYETLQGLIAQRTVELNAIIQQSEIDTTNVTLEQWQKRAEALGEWAEMVGETMGEVYMLERQANNARARGDEETAKQLETQAKESRQNLVKEALNKAIDMAKVWAMELGFKVMYNALAKKSDEDVAAGGAKATLKGALAEIIANGFKGAGKEVGTKGIAGLATGAIIIAAAAGLAALAKSAVNNMFSEATEGVSDAEASAPKRKLTTGMLTYAEGKYPVLGNDGVVYDAEYAGANMKTGVYRKPHFGIFAEKQPEMVIDGKTTQRLVLNYPEIYSGILELSRTGRMGMRTYATGNVLEIGEGYDAQAHQAQQQMQMEAMNQTLAATAAAVAALTRRLDQPIHAEMNYFGKGGAREAEQRGSRWAARNRVK